MLIRNVRLANEPGLWQLLILDGCFTQISPMADDLGYEGPSLDGEGGLAMAPFVEPHIHLDATQSAGQPAWNRSGTLFEGIERWAERKATLTHEDVKQRAWQTLKWQMANGIQAVRTHVDVSDPSLLALKALLEVKAEVAPYLDLQLVAFPQEGILSYPNGEALLEEALRLGADVVGAIPHFEFTRELGVESLHKAFALAARYDRLIDVHCDEIDDEQSRFWETLAWLTQRDGLGARVTASHTTAMGSYDNAYCFKLFRLLNMSGINFVSCPTESIHLQGRFDSFPKRRGVTRVAELDRAGMNVCLGQDSIKDPWYPLGNGNILRVLDAGLHICHMMGFEDLQRCLDLVTDNSARTLNLGEGYGIAVGRPANLVILDADSDYEAVRRQAKARVSIRGGKVLMTRVPERVEFTAA